MKRYYHQYSKNGEWHYWGLVSLGGGYKTYEDAQAMINAIFGKHETIKPEMIRIVWVEINEEFPSKIIYHRDNK